MRPTGVENGITRNEYRCTATLSELRRCADARELVRVLADLHAVDIEAVGLTITARDATRLDTVATQLRHAGAPEVVAVAPDMADADSVDTILAKHSQRFETLPALILNAGVGTAEPVAEASLHRFDKTISVNLRAPLQLIRGALPMLRADTAREPERGAKIVAISSITGVYAEAGLGCTAQPKQH